MQLLCHKEESNFIFVPAIRTTRNQLWHIKQRKKKDFFSSVLSHRVFIFFTFYLFFLYRSRGFCIYLFFFCCM